MITLILTHSRIRISTDLPSSSSDADTAALITMVLQGYRDSDCTFWS